ncbi:MAG: LPS assembly protein LptD [Paracoccaceae bacterium]|nr:LPS assembly protein LptD [Paracoccaceae bacterium]
MGRRAKGTGSRWAAWALLLSLAAGIAGPAGAETASLVADRILLDGEAAIVAEGNVEIFYEGAALSARRLRYDGETDTLTIEGPIRLTDGEGVVILADAAELDGDLRNGILSSARFVLDRQLQLTAARITRVEGRYTELSRTIASSCRICADGSPPIWEIRAGRVIHDQQERQLYLDDAQFRVGGVPVFYWPTLRLPDPTLTRATGFLFPQLVTTTQLGTGAKVPYFIRIGDHADVTLTPYLSTVTATLEARYRQVFRGGELSFRGAVSQDGLTDGARSYLFGEGRFALPRGFVLNFDVELVSDPAYLLEYDYSDKDRLDSAISIGRTRRDAQSLFEFTEFRTLRASEIPVEDEIPRTLFEVRSDRQVSPDVFGGPLWLSLDIMALTRPSDEDGLGRDVLRTGAGLRWSGSRLVGPGIVVETETGAEIQVYAVNQDEDFGLGTVRATPSAAVTLRWPLLRRTSDGALQTLEPVAMLAWSRTSGAEVPDEDSITPELDEGNLFTLSRYPGSDRTEEGFRGSLGVNWSTRYAGGGEIGLTLGRIFRLDELGREADDVADWLASIRLIGVGGVQAFGRLLAEDDVGLTRAIGTLAWTGPRARASASFIRAFTDPDAPSEDDTTEIAFDGGLNLSRHWSGSLDWRYDLEASRATSAGVGFNFRNECVDVELALSQRYTESTSVEPETRASVSVSLGGIGGGGAGPVSQCRG